MKAAVVRTFGAPLEIEDVHLAAPEPGEVRVRIGAVAICGSDLHAIDGAWGGSTPTVNGHEAAGVVAECGAGVTSVDTGDHVVVSLLRTCGDCVFCRRHQTYLCEGHFALNTETRLTDAAGMPITQGIYVGAFAEEVVVHESQLVAIDPAVPLDAASLLACGVPTGFGAVVHTAEVPPGSSVAVIGVGGVGINCLQGAVAARAAPIVAVDLSDRQLRSALDFGATHAVRADAPNLAARSAEITGGRGADYVFVAAGSTRAIESGLGLARRGGTLVIVGITEADAHARIDTGEFASSGRRILGSKMGSTNAARDVPALVRRYQRGELRLDELISARFRFGEINEAIAAARTGQTLRNVVVFDGVP